MNNEADKNVVNIRANGVHGADGAYSGRPLSEATESSMPAAGA